MVFMLVGMIQHPPASGGIGGGVHYRGEGPIHAEVLARGPVPQGGVAPGGAVPVAVAGRGYRVRHVRLTVRPRRAAATRVVCFPIPKRSLLGLVQRLIEICLCYFFF